MRLNHVSDYRPRKRTKNPSLAKRRATVAACVRRWRERENQLAALGESHPLAAQAARLKDWITDHEFLALDAKIKALPTPERTPFKAEYTRLYNSIGARMEERKQAYLAAKRAALQAIRAAGAVDPFS
jgi:chromosome segregation ATPase